MKVKERTILDHDKLLLSGQSEFALMEEEEEEDTDGNQKPNRDGGSNKRMKLEMQENIHDKKSKSGSNRGNGSR